MNLLHTWAGILFGGLVFLIFFMGTISVFDDELDRWMMPQTRAAATGDVGYDAALATVLGDLEVEDEPVFLYPPGPRRPVYAAHYHGPGDTHLQRFVDPGTGEMLPPAGTLGAGGFFYPMHYGLHLDKAGMPMLGYWIVGLAAMVVLAMSVSGVIVHRRILRDLFSFRAERARGRALLDLHNIGGVMALPFLFVMTLSGLIIFAHMHMPAGVLAAYPDADTFFHDAFPHPDREPAGRPGALASVDAMVAEADRIWGGGRPLGIGVIHPGDADAYVAMYRYTGDTIGYDYEQLTFDGASGALMHHQRVGPAMTVYRFLTGLHIAMFDHWSVLWLYFLMGLCCCAVIATGFLVWLDKRAQRAGRLGYRIVQAVGGASTAGLALATVAMLAANRLLPDVPGRADTEIAVFLGAWGCSLLAGLLRPGMPHLRLQLGALAAGLCSLPLLNALTTGDHLLRTVSRGDWATAGCDLAFITFGLLSAGAWRALSPRHGTTAVTRADAIRGSAA